ncbi:MAG: fumarylacetoacetate hydrolase family protein [Pseudomonadota bacterium]|nr:fumarylacetoacetate hydrolase family protein [Pseudomonadota bacterium]
MTYVFQPPPPPVVPVAGDDAVFPVHRIYCVGRNYAAHAREMGADDREPPFFFAKPADAVVPRGGEIAYPSDTAELHHEVELVLAIGRGGVEIPSETALDHVYGYAVGLDLTRRDRQAEAKKAGRPWDVAKGFDRSAPIGAIRPVSAGGHVRTGRIQLAVEGAVRQDGDISDMVWSPAEIIAALSRSFELAPGDLVFTGTPEGVGPLGRGQVAAATAADLEPLLIRLV